MNLLILGGTRFMGKYIVKEMINKGHNVTVVTRGITPHDFSDKATHIIADRTDASSLKAIPNITYDVIFDSLAYCSMDVKNLLDNVKCKRYIQISSLSVYPDLYMNMTEDGFDANEHQLVWCQRDYSTYDEIKRQAECAIVKEYPQISSVRVRFPFVIGKDDYTNRLFFYVKNVIDGKPMFIDNHESQLAFVRSDEAGKFVAFFADNTFNGAINGASQQTISIKEILDYIKSKTNKTPILSDDGEKAPYNGAESYSINTDKSQNLGYFFTPLKEWIYDLIDYYIEIS